MPRWGMTIDLDLCTGCGACVAACAQENNVPGGNFAQPPDRIIRWVEIMRTEENEFPHTQLQQTPMPCQHCENPPCVKVCPVGATYKTEEGLVPQIYGQCIGCRYCVNACPYTVKQFNWEDPTFPGQMERGCNPDVSIRERGVVEECNFCEHRLQKARDAVAGDGKDPDTGTYKTACQTACPAQAINFGNLADEDSLLAKDARSPRGMRLLEELGTSPKVIYLKARE
jgi:menaquinone reductase, iron-sulfur cluster-binding subunit